MKLKIPKNVEALIQARAAAGGFSTVEAYILNQLGLENFPPILPTLSQEQWLQKFDAFVAKQTSRSPHFDDSREGIYPVR